MKISLMHFWNGRNSLDRVISPYMKAKLKSATLSWKFSKFIKAFDKEFIDIEKTRQELVKKFGEEITITKENLDSFKGTGLKVGEKTISIPKEKEKDFFEEFGEFLKTEVEFDMKLKLNDLDSALQGSDVEIGVEDMMLLEKFIEE